MFRSLKVLTLVLPISVMVACQAHVGQDTDKSSAVSGSLVVYSGRQEKLVQPIIDQFAAASGIDVQVKYGKTAEIAATLLEEGDNTPADIFWAQDPGGLGAVSQADMLADLPDALLNKVSSPFRSPDGMWVGISGRARTIVYNTDTINPDQIPQDMWGFTAPDWKGRIGWAPTNASFQVMITAMRNVWGDRRTSEWLEGIMDNDPSVYPKNTPIVAAAASGEIDVGFVNHYYLYRFIAAEGETFAARNHFLTGGGPGSLVMVSGVSRLAISKNQEEALKFIEFLLSPVAQQYFASTTYEYPMVDGVKVHSELAPLSELNTVEIDLADLADLQGTIDLLMEVGALE